MSDQLTRRRLLSAAAAAPVALAAASLPAEAVPIAAGGGRPDAEAAFAEAREILAQAYARRDPHPAWWEERVEILEQISALGVDIDENPLWDNVHRLETLITDTPAFHERGLAAKIRLHVEFEFGPDEVALGAAALAASCTDERRLLAQMWADAERITDPDYWERADVQERDRRIEDERRAATG